MKLKVEEELAMRKILKLVGKNEQQIEEVIKRIKEREQKDES